MMNCTAKCPFQHEVVDNETTRTTCYILKVGLNQLRLRKQVINHACNNLMLKHSVP